MSFDNGPDLEETPKVLDILKKYGVLATFFLVCNKLEAPAMRDMAKRTKDEGHWIGNHTLSHRTPLGMNPDPGAPLREIGRAQELLGDLAHPRKFFRPNGKGQVGPHLLSRAAVELLEAERFTCILWSIMPRDGTDPPGWVDRALGHCVKSPRSTVVVHDRVNGGMPYLEDFIVKVRQAGGTFNQEFNPEVVAVSEGRRLLPFETIASDDNQIQDTVSR
ncbi:MULTISPECIES: polysaccharide deacetylase family protein [unclassified Sinorhizobium]|uniref:polysaccharide deacetylase family protein n=1 Tax=unclassified Sinorhizobium TaxID=2613772 RepID=UPI0035268AE6